MSSHKSLLSCLVHGGDRDHSAVQYVTTRREEARNQNLQKENNVPLLYHVRHYILLLYPKIFDSASSIHIPRPYIILANLTSFQLHRDIHKVINRSVHSVLMFFVLSTSCKSTLEVCYL